MTFRPKTFLTYLALCLAPLLLLAAISHWNGMNVVDTTVETEAQNNLNALTWKIDRSLQEEEAALTRLSQSQPMRDFAALSEKDANQTANSIPGAGRSSIDLPNQLLVSIASILKGRGHYTMVGLYGQNRRPLFQIERDEIGLTFHKAGLAPHALPPFPLNNPVAPVLSGSILQYAVPVSAENSKSATALLVGELNLDEVFAETANVLVPQESRGGSSGPMIVVLDNSERIVYHTERGLQDKLVSSAMPGFLPIADAMVANKSGIERYQAPGGLDHLSAFAPLPRFNIAIAVARDRAQLVSGARRRSIFIFAFAVVLGLVGGTLLERHVQKRSRGIERVTEDLTAIAKGELDRRIELKSSDDARGIADNINVVTERLRAQIAREAESRQFQSFVRVSAMLTHDLKNAIEVLSLTVGNMERHYDNPQFRADAMKSLAGATDKLKSIVARLSKPLTSLSGEHKRPANVDLIPILKRVVARMAEPLREKHTVVLRLPPTLLALVDAARIEEAMENLVLNALEAMIEKSGTLTIEAGTLPNGAATFSVGDTGPGMSRTFIDKRLFLPFSTTKKNGVGLGLYACREVIEGSAGSIKVESVEGAGTTFRVVLPSASHDSRS